MQLALEAFEAEEWGDLVGALSSSAVADLDEATVSDREAKLTGASEGNEIVVGSGTRRSVKGNAFTINEYHLWNVRAPTGALPPASLPALPAACASCLALSCDSPVGADSCDRSRVGRGMCQ